MTSLWVNFILYTYAHTLLTFFIGHDLHGNQSTNCWVNIFMANGQMVFTCTLF